MNDDISATKIIVGSILGLIVVFCISWACGFFGLFYDKTIGTEEINIQREQFKNSKSYVEGMVSDLSKFKYEYETEKDPINKKAIINLIISKYGNFNEMTKIEDLNLRTFLQDVKNGKYNN